jgi:hypothetical protein
MQNSPRAEHSLFTWYWTKLCWLQGLCSVNHVTWFPYKTVNIKLSLSTQQRRMGRGGITPPVLNLSTRSCNQLYSRPLYPWEEGSWYSVKRRLPGLQSRPGRFGEKKYLSCCRKSKHDSLVIPLVSSHCTDWAILGLLLSVTMCAYCPANGLLLRWWSSELLYNVAL